MENYCDPDHEGKVTPSFPHLLRRPPDGWVLKRSGRTGDEVLEELADTAVAWMRERVD